MTKQKAKVSAETFAFCFAPNTGSAILCGAIVNCAHAFVIYVGGFVNYAHAIVNAAQVVVIPAHPIVNHAFGFVICVPGIVSATQVGVTHRNCKVIYDFDCLSLNFAKYPSNSERSSIPTRSKISSKSL